eukprot:1879337-Pyramimonas_sp.AAC.3
MLYYTHCANRLGTSLPCRAAHARFISMRHNHPPTSSTANNSGSHFLAARTGMRGSERKAERERGT